MTGQRVMNRWFVVLGAILIQMCLGAVYAWSVFTPALKAAGWSKLDTQAVFSVGLVTFAVVMVWAGRRIETWGPRRLAVCSGVVLGLGYVLAGLLGGTDFWALVFFIGVIGGTGIGLGYVVPIAVGMRWFPDRKGMITGLAVAGFGFGAMAWVKIAGSWGGLIQGLGLSATFTVYGVVFAALIVTGAIWMVYPPEGWMPLGSTPSVTGGNAGKTATGAVDFGCSEMLRTVHFYMIFLTFAISAGAGLMTIGLMKLYPMEALQTSGFNQAAASGIAGTAMAVFFSLANGVGRIAWGALSDRIGSRRSILIMTSTQGFIVIIFTAMAGNEYMLYLGAALIGFNFGGNFALFPTITAETFGSRRIGENYPYVFLSYGAGGVFGPMLGGMLGDAGNFAMAFTICGLLCICGAIFMSFVGPVRGNPVLVPERETEAGPVRREPALRLVPRNARPGLAVGTTGPGTGPPLPASARADARTGAG